MLTHNEKQVLRLLATSLTKEHSINEIAKLCKITPNGAYKILAKLEALGVLKARHIANIKSYKLDFAQERTVRVLELAMMPDMLEKKIQARAEDLQSLRTLTQACVIFGSYITPKQKPGDIDILFILKRTDYARYKQALAKSQEIIPIKIQDVVQTSEDIAQNLRKDDPIITEALRHGIVLWGFEILVKGVKDASG